jgi:hypothetical protein
MRSVGRPKGGRRSVRCEGGWPCRSDVPTTAGASYTTWRYAKGGWFVHGGSHCGRVDGDSGPSLTPMLRVWDTTIPPLAPRRLEFGLAARTDDDCMSPMPDATAQCPSRASRPTVTARPFFTLLSFTRAAVGPCYRAQPASVGVEASNPVAPSFQNQQNASAKPVVHGPGLLSVNALDGPTNTKTL